MLEKILCPGCRLKLLQEKVYTGGRYFICECGYDSRINNNYTPAKQIAVPKNLDFQTKGELISHLAFLETECQKMRSEIDHPDVLQKHIEILPKIYANLRIILKEE